MDLEKPDSASVGTEKVAIVRKEYEQENSVLYYFLAGLKTAFAFQSEYTFKKHSPFT